MKRDNCRLCFSKNLEMVMPLVATPLEDEFLKQIKHQPVYPLDVYLCLDCGHVQNLDVVNPDLIYSKYTYKTSINPGLVQHFKDYANQINQLIPPSSFVVDIGSNDGTLLKEFKAKGHRVLGVDPAYDIALEATESGIPTLPDFFGSGLANVILNQKGKANLICANNVFAHSDHLDDIVKGIKLLLDDDGIFIFECSYLLDVIDNFAFDTINHDHLSHHTIIPLMRFLRKHFLELYDIQRINTKGGSIRGFVTHKKNTLQLPSKNLIEFYHQEIKREIRKPTIYQDFYKSIQDKKKELLGYLDTKIPKESIVAGYGASCTTTALTYQFDLGNILYYLIDANPIKQETFSPGFHIPVVGSKILNSEASSNDIVIILAWLYADQIIEKHKDFIEKGGTFIVPLPKLKIVSNNFKL